MQMKSINPATEEILGVFNTLSFEDALGTAHETKKAQKSWGVRPAADRSPLFKKLASVLRAHADECAKLMTLEMGKPITQSKTEVEKCAWLCDFYADAAAEFLRDEVIKTEAQKSYVRFDPLGVVLGVMPWNFPFWQVIRFAVPALAAGNGVLLKHASNVPQCALKIEELFLEAGFPAGIFKTLLIDSKTAMALIETDGVDAVSLTGSTQAGAEVAAIAGKNLKKCVLELGGSDPFIVLADADIDLAAKTALQARTINTGQSCIAAKRFIIEKSVAAEFEKKMVENFKTLKMGDQTDATVNISPLAKAEFVDALEKQVEDAVNKGAKILSGGAREKGTGYFFEPTLLGNCTRDMAVFHEEVFGPVMPLFVVGSADEAIEMANDSEFGLGAAIFTRDLARAEKLAARIESGHVAINGMVKSDPRLPFGGIKKSGFGREMGSYGIKEFVNIKTIVINS